MVDKSTPYKKSTEVKKWIIVNSLYKKDVQKS